METNNNLLNTPERENLGITNSKPKFPQYAVLSKRRNSYSTWPEYLPLSPGELSDAGLVYTGVGDSVRCYYCGGGLRNWERGDNAWYEHAKWYPTCPHVLLVRGQCYVDSVARGESPDRGAERLPETTTTTTITEERDHLDSPAALSCLENGFSSNMVKRAIDHFIKTEKHHNFRGEDLCRIMFEMEEEDDRPVATQATNNTEVVGAATGDDENDEDDLETLFAENRRLKDDTVCKICLDSTATIIFLPCGHMVSCPQCAPALAKCPVCRKSVKGVVKAQVASSITSRDTR